MKQTLQIPQNQGLAIACGKVDAYENKRYFYQLDGEGIRNQMVTFLRAIENKGISQISKNVSIGIVRLMQDYFEEKRIVKLVKN